MVIRPARHEDWDAFRELALAMHGESRFRNKPMNEDKIRAAFAHHIDYPAGGCLLLAQRADGTLAGMLAGVVVDFFFCDGRVAQDRAFFVRSEFRGTSAAVRLLTAFRRWAENRGAVELNINMSVAVDMARFDRFMEHLGFSCCGSNFYLALRRPEHVIPAQVHCCPE